MMKNFIITAILILITGPVIRYLIKAKRRGQTCIGCPCAKRCDRNCSSNCNGGTDTKIESSYKEI